MTFAILVRNGARCRLTQYISRRDVNTLFHDKYLRVYTVVLPNKYGLNPPLYYRKVK
jgi:hypothetical protein